VIEIARVKDEKAQGELLNTILSGATVREVREKAKATKPTKAGKGKTKSTQKIPVTKGWVIIHCTKKTAGKEDYIEALQEALKAARKLED
jgi:parvulin-like peptidyl-prolyl isomerase